MSTLDEEKIFRVAIDIESASLRSVYLDQVCGTNTTLRLRLDNLLVADQEPCSILDTPHGESTPGSSEEESGDMPEVPGYLFLRKIGEGGMGVVYLAEQLDPIRRKVALKLLSRFSQMRIHPRRQTFIPVRVRCICGHRNDW